MAAILLRHNGVKRRILLLPVLSVAVSAPLAAVCVNSEIPQTSIFLGKKSGGKTNRVETLRLKSDPPATIVLHFFNNNWNIFGLLCISVKFRIATKYKKSRDISSTILDGMPSYQ